MFLVTVGGLFLELWRKKRNANPEFRYKQEAIIDIGRNRVSEIHVACTRSIQSISDTKWFLSVSSSKETFEGHTLLIRCRNTNSSVPFFRFQFHEFYETGACKLISRWLHYVELDSDYVEVYQIKTNKILFSMNIFGVFYFAYRVLCRRGGIT